MNLKKGWVMNNKAQLLAAQMLADYCDKLSGNRCNDWEYPEGWTREGSV